MEMNTRDGELQRGMPRITHVLIHLAERRTALAEERAELVRKQTGFSRHGADLAGRRTRRLERIEAGICS